MTDRERRKCIKCGGLRVYMGEGVEEKTLTDGRTVREADFKCLDCGRMLFNYQWLVAPERFMGPSYLDDDAETG
jgi:hypothetical protein